MACSLPYPDKPRNGADDRDDRHRLHGQGRESRTRSFSHRRNLLHGDIHDRFRLQHRVPNHYCQKKRGKKLQRDREHILSRGMFPARTGGAHSHIARTAVAVAYGKNRFLAACGRRCHELREMAAAGTVLRLYHSHVQGILYRDDTDQDIDTELDHDGIVQHCLQLDSCVREIRDSGFGDSGASSSILS